MGLGETYSLSSYEVKGFPTTLFTSQHVRSPNVQQLGHSLVAHPLHICSNTTIFRRRRCHGEYSIRL